MEAEMERVGETLPWQQMSGHWAREGPANSTMNSVCDKVMWNFQRGECLRTVIDASSMCAYVWECACVIVRCFVINCCVYHGGCVCVVSLCLFETLTLHSKQVTYSSSRSTGREGKRLRHIFTAATNWGHLVASNSLVYLTWRQKCGEIKIKLLIHKTKVK